MAIGGEASCERYVDCNLGRKGGRAGLEVSLGGEKEVGRPKGKRNKKKRKGKKRKEEMGWADLGLGPTVLVFLF